MYISGLVQVDRSIPMSKRKTYSVTLYPCFKFQVNVDAVNLEQAIENAKAELDAELSCGADLMDQETLEAYGDSMVVVEITEELI